MSSFLLQGGYVTVLFHHPLNTGSEKLSKTDDNMGDNRPKEFQNCGINKPRFPFIYHINIQPKQDKCHYYYHTYTQAYTHVRTVHFSIIVCISLNTFSLNSTQSIVITVIIHNRNPFGSVSYLCITQQQHT